MATMDVIATLPFHAVAAANPNPGATLDLRSVLAGVGARQAARLDTSASMTREELAYSLVQALGLEAAARAHTGDVTVSCDGTSYTLSDQGSIAPEYRGYVQYALKLKLLPARYTLMQRNFDPVPGISASFGPTGKVTRAEYAAATTRFLGAFLASAWLHRDAPCKV